jgi:hypothetical protein
MDKNARALPNCNPEVTGSNHGPGKIINIIEKMGFLTLNESTSIKNRIGQLSWYSLYQQSTWLEKVSTSIDAILL